MNKVHNFAFKSYKINNKSKIKIMISSFKSNMIQDCKLWKIAQMIALNFHQTCNKFARCNQIILKKIQKWYLKNNSPSSMLFNQILIKNFKTLNFHLK